PDAPRGAVPRNAVVLAGAGCGRLASGAFRSTVRELLRHARPAPRASRGRGDLLRAEVQEQGREPDPAEDRRRGAEDRRPRGGNGAAEAAQGRGTKEGRGGSKGRGRTQGRRAEASGGNRRAQEGRGGRKEEEGRRRGSEKGRTGKGSQGGRRSSAQEGRGRGRAQGAGGTPGAGPEGAARRRPGAPGGAGRGGERRRGDRQHRRSAASACGPGLEPSAVGAAVHDSGAARGHAARR